MFSTYILIFVVFLTSVLAQGRVDPRCYLQQCGGPILERSNCCEHHVCVAPNEMSPRQGHCVYWPFRNGFRPNPKNLPRDYLERGDLNSVYKQFGPSYGNLRPSSFGQQTPYSNGVSNPHYQGIPNPYFQGASNPQFQGASNPNFQGVSNPHFQGATNPYFQGGHRGFGLGLRSLRNETTTEAPKKS